MGGPKDIRCTKHYQQLRQIWPHIGNYSQALNELTPYQKEILTLRFGLEGQRTHSIKELSQRRAVSAQAIDRVLARTIAKLGEKNENP